MKYLFRNLSIVKTVKEYLSFSEEYYENDTICFCSYKLHIV